ncbi:enoyl-CoA hydratase [Fictibacillus barbaricus]|uniref:Enoyl-CoA hydratase n=1 Tax=Fictibacillus barbaricus TaxID=182136 RepID=A0ABU1U2N1_9BACL|nr:enoyl-CoA hydratase [Fictibacillus barbaricus]MDR7073713.1 enoyl-CoA hydratase [Fictibacillus barbaricus]
MEFLQVDKQGKIATIKLNRAPANALSTGVIQELDQALDQIEQDREVKAVVILGEGRFFSAGADIKEFTEVQDEEGFAQLGKKGQDVFNRIEQFSKPVIAAIHGAALGGGLELAMSCHIRLVADDAKLGLPELTLGLVPGFAGTQRLPQLVGVPKACEMLLSSKPVTGKEAAELGLANESMPAEDLFERAYKMAESFSEKSAVSIKYTLELLHYARAGLYEKGSVKEQELFGKAFKSHDGQEGIQAFIEKRKPEFQDR